MSSTNQIDVVIVEPHHHVLEHIHHVMRRSYRKTKRCLQKSSGNNNNNNNNNASWTMIHFDSHPDLACPNESIPATLCFTPRRRISPLSAKQDGSIQMKIDQSVNQNDDNDFHEGKDLYECLDTSQSGIAEWIIPLVLSGDLKTLFWIKNEWCHQFLSGGYSFNIGAWIPPSIQRRTQKEEVKHQGVVSSSEHNDQTFLIESSNEKNEIASFLDLPDEASVKTSFYHEYYLDDDCVVPDDELQVKQQLDYIVVDLRKDTSQCKTSQPMTEKGCNKNHQDFNGNEWILDVCLDYFVCYNPFLFELESIDKHLTDLLVDAVNGLKIHSTLKETGSMPSLFPSSGFGVQQGQEYLTMSKQFYELATMFFQNVTIRFVESSSSMNPNHDIFLDEHQYNDLYNLYSQPSIGKEIWDDLTGTLLEWSNDKPIDEIRNLCGMIVNALPSISLPHPAEYASFEGHNGSCLMTLPTELLSRVKLFGDDLKHRRWEQCYNHLSSISNDGKHLHPYPSIVTIARSSEDGFTPPNIIDALQEAVLNEIDNVFGACKLNVVLDFGEHEGSTLE